jgi:hypothetical protein
MFKVAVAPKRGWLGEMASAIRAVRSEKQLRKKGSPHLAYFAPEPPFAVINMISRAGAICSSKPA